MVGFRDLVGVGIAPVSKNLLLRQKSLGFCIPNLKNYTTDIAILQGVFALANYFGLEELMEELKTIQTKSDPSLSTLRKKSIPEIIYLHFGKKKYRSYKEEPFEIRKSNLTRIPESTIAKYFSGN